MSVPNPKRSNSNWNRPVLVALVVLSLMAPSCGTLFYPERRGQDDGRLDVAIVLLDGIGLFFWIIPGIVAYAVDIATGASHEPSIGTQLEDAVDG